MANSHALQFLKVITIFTTVMFAAAQIPAYAADQNSDCPANANWEDASEIFTKITASTGEVQVLMHCYAEGCYIRTHTEQGTMEFISLTRGPTLTKGPKPHSIYEYSAIAQITTATSNLLAKSAQHPCSIGLNMDINIEVPQYYSHNTTPPRIIGDMHRSGFHIEYQFSEPNGKLQDIAEIVKYNGTVDFQSALEPFPDNFSLTDWFVDKNISPNTRNFEKLNVASFQGLRARLAAQPAAQL